MLNLALIGAGGHGAFLINEVVTYSRGLPSHLGGVDVVAVCDVDEKRARETVSHNHPAITATNDAGFKRFPKARRYNDFRKLFDWEEKNIDAAVVATPDHTHIPASVMAMRMGKHVYCEKPLGQNVHAKYASQPKWLDRTKWPLRWGSEITPPRPSDALSS